ncbi:uncharacterized protein LOC116164058 [Photinus pyralis]|uniref:uncharacterized protein LOC116164058 n=1 Tax=Photinus pyralis TaxID=7054 RepID=UPI0012671E8A|nr:uncharacterized protein LOC116164058 [Photinus pyralis]
MYAQKKHVTVVALNAEIKNSHVLLSDRSLNRAVHALGFKFKKDSNRRALIEKPNIAEMRTKFLRQYMQEIRSSSRRPIVFMDETWIYSKGNPGKSWQDEDLKSVRKPAGYDGKRFIIVHAGTSTGFIQNASLLFVSKSLKEDYHGEMNGDLFKKWLINNLLNNLEEPSLIVIDNAPYHSTLEKLPTSSWTKGDMVAGLTRRNIPFDSTLFKPELYSFIKSLGIQKQYEVDNIIRNHGHDVLRLPPYHCEFNAIELVWAHAKSYYDKHIGRDGYSDHSVISMWNEALQQCDETFWANCVRHTEDVIKAWYKREEVLDFICKRNDN